MEKFAKVVTALSLTGIVVLLALPVNSSTNTADTCYSTERF